MQGEASQAQGAEGKEVFAPTYGTAALIEAARITYA